MASIRVTALTGLSNEKNRRRGESNLIRREESCTEQGILIAAVDTGNNKDSEIAEVLCQSQVQILVLTHDDDDHIKGAKHVLKNSIEPIRELWIPAYWMMEDQILDRLINPGPSTADDSEEIAAALGLARIAASSEDGCFLESTFESIFDFTAIAGDRRSEGMEESDIQADVRQSYAHLEGVTEEMPRPRFDAYLEAGLRVALDALKAEDVSLRQMLTGQYAADENLGRAKRKLGSGKLAERTRGRIAFISEILAAARHRNTEIRCFLPVTDAVHRRSEPPVSPVWETSGQPEFLTILNAVEVVVRKPRILGVRALFMTLAALEGLSQQNRCALVNFVWPTRKDSQDGFVVWSDSGGEWLHIPRFSVPWDLIGGMTAPHHGSENAAHTQIWEELANKKGTTRIIVSGDLSERRGSVARATAIHDVLKRNNASEYGVVHCLDPKAKSRFPRADVQYSSVSPGGCWSLYGSCLHHSPHAARPYTEIRLLRSAKKCSPDCLGCKK